jgi:hypothetical protein
MTDKPVVVYGVSGYTGRLMRSFGLVMEPQLTVTC